MESIALVNMFMFVGISSICIFIGLDLKKWPSWLIGFYGFLSGFWVGYINWGSPSEFSIKSGLQLGLLFAFAVVIGGTLVRHYRQRYGKEAAKVWLLRYGQNEYYSLLARMMRKLLGK